MILLAAESCLLYQSLKELEQPGNTGNIINQFFHHPWHGFHFWDLIQPAFMTIAGCALYFSYYKHIQNGISRQQNFKKIITRCGKLFLLGIALHCVYAGKLVWELWNVLTQLSVTTLIAYLLIGKPLKIQIPSKEI